MTTVKRLTAVGLLLAVVLSGMLLLRPTETTLAAWSDEVTVPLPPLKTGGVRLDITPTRSAATVGMGGDTAGTWRPASVRVSVDGRALTGAELAGSRVEYRLAGDGGTCPTSGAPSYAATASGSASSFTVTGGERLSGERTLCLSFVPSDQVRIVYGERTLSLTTTIDGVSTAPATWTAAGSWDADHPMPAGPSTSGPHCSDNLLNTRVTLSWDWDRAGLSQDVTRWSLQVQDRGSWREVDSLGARERSTTIRPRDFNIIDFGTYQIRVAAVLPDGTTIPSTSTADLRVGRILLGSVSCA